MIEFTRDDLDTRVYEELHDGAGDIVYKDLFFGLHRLGCHIQVWTLEPGVIEGDHEHSDDDLEEAEAESADEAPTPAKWADEGLPA